MSSLLDRYLAAVAEALPDGVDRDDVLAEITDDLQSQIEAGKDEAEVLRAYGHPRVVASRYGASQYLIGPQLYPFYIPTLRNVAVVTTAAILLIGGIAAILKADGSLFLTAMGQAWDSLLWIFLVVTVIFAVVDRVANVRPAWDPNTLSEPAPVNAIPRASSLIEFVVNFIALLVFLDAPGSHRIPLDAAIAQAVASSGLTLTGAWHAVYLGAVFGTALLIGSAILTFIQPRFSTLHLFFRALSSLIEVTGCIIALSSGSWILPASSIANDVAKWSLTSAVVVLLLHAGLCLYQASRALRIRATSAAR
jgi:hypothetical protein